MESFLCTPDGAVVVSVVSVVAVVAVVAAVVSGVGMGFVFFNRNHPVHTSTLDRITSLCCVNVKRARLKIVSGAGADVDTVVKCLPRRDTTVNPSAAVAAYPVIQATQVPNCSRKRTRTNKAWRCSCSSTSILVDCALANTTSFAYTPSGRAGEMGGVTELREAEELAGVAGKEGKEGMEVLSEGCDAFFGELSLMLLLIFLFLNRLLLLLLGISGISGISKNTDSAGEEATAF
jgi:hypothetical protein